jgi:hypothetical protein
MGVIKKIALFTLLAFAFYFLTAQQTKNEMQVKAIAQFIGAFSRAIPVGKLSYPQRHVWLYMDWFRNGLNRFDGNSFKVYLHDPKKNNTIPDNAIQGLVEDSLHNIWFGT